MTRALLMIPGPVEVSPAVQQVLNTPVPGHLAPNTIEAFGSSLEMMRRVWKASSDSQPFIIAGSGSLAMEMSIANLVGEGDEALVLDTGYFSQRMAEMLRRHRASVSCVEGQPGHVPALEQVETQLKSGRFKTLFMTHVDTSTGVAIDPEPLVRLARSHDVQVVVDGVCATAAERFEMEAWDADVYLTGSQKAIGIPPGLALMVAKPRAIKTRQSMQQPPAMYFDWQQWIPIMHAYERREPSYFATPATSLLMTLDVGLREILADTFAGKEGIDARVARHQWTGAALRRAWKALGLTSLVAKEEHCANTLSALRYPTGIDGSLVARIKEEGVVVAGGLYPTLKDQYFRIGHMGYCTTQPDMLLRTVRAVGRALQACGHTCDPEAAVAASELDTMDTTAAKQNSH